ncbi:MAG: flagellar biosynthesis protein FlhA [Bryobacterales bacterium]|nr:flagellar biosynthesis protein FlhA [Bryobacterales bacterium]
MNPAHEPKLASPVSTAINRGAGTPPVWMSSLRMLADLGVPLGVLITVVAMITPLPGFLLDLLIVCNVTLSVIVLLVSMYILKPVEFSVFPATLLLLTLFRLALNISSSRLILLNGNTGTSAAGHVIEAFGQFVVGGNYVIGTVIFLVLIAIQYVVINHGAVRISEVTARFTLDALPGKQMSIDSDLNAGLIDEAEARQRRKSLAAEAEFYGSMDGASRFTQRDAIASILITGINIVAGFLIGILQHGMPLLNALQTYTVLTIGDGLVTVIPALMISISGGLIVTRAGSEKTLGAEFKRQMFGSAQPLLLASVALGGLAMLPGLPKIPFLLLGGAVGYAGWQLKKDAAKAAEPAVSVARIQPRERVENLLKVDPLALEIGLGLVRHVDGGANSPLLRRIASIRKQLAGDLGYVLPPVRVTDNLSLKAREYVVLLKGAEIARIEMPAGHELAIRSRADASSLDGEEIHDPAFGLPSFWIAAERREEAKQKGYTVADALSVMGTHLTELVRKHAHELFSRQDAKRFLDRVAEDNPKTVEDLVPKQLPLSGVQRVLQNLLRERVSIRDGASILEAIGEASQNSRNVVLLTEYVRQSIRRILVQSYLNSQGDLPIYFLSPALEQLVEQHVEHGELSSHLQLGVDGITRILEAVSRTLDTREGDAVLLVSAGSRPFVSQILESSLPSLAVLSHNEIPPGIRLLSRGTVQ